jgi:hypothetical protein
MKQLIEYPTESGEPILVEIEIHEVEEGGEIEVARFDGFKKAVKTFEESLSSVKPVVKSIVNKLSDLIEKPHEINVEFGVKMGAKGGIIVASSDIEGNFKVTLKWNQG